MTHHPFFKLVITTVTITITIIKMKIDYDNSGIKYLKAQEIPQLFQDITGNFNNKIPNY